MASDRRIRDFRCFTFKGRMRRKPFWFWLLPYFLTCCVLGTLLALTFIAADSSAALSILLLIIFFTGLVGTVIACYAIFFQRLHDIGLSGWWAIGMMIFGVICAVVDSVFETGVFSALDSIVNLIFLLALGILLLSLKKISTDRTPRRTVSSSIGRKLRHRLTERRPPNNRKSILLLLPFSQKSFSTQHGTPSR